MSEESIPAGLQQKIQQLQGLNEQMQVAASQRGQMEVMFNEAKRALEAIEGLADDAPVYRSVGGLLVKEKDKATVQERLTEETETMELRVERLKKQETQIRESLRALQKEIEAALGPAAGA